MFQKRPLILASKSPRRSQLLREAGFEFRVQTFETDESFDAKIPLDFVAPMLAQRKARAAAHLITDREVILAADSTVIVNNTILNKPANFDEAFWMIQQLSGKRHTVVTGCCLLAREKEDVFACSTDVWFSPMTDAEIQYYIETYQPYDKAGAYGVQEWIGHCKIVRIEGSYTNVMGLPLHLVYDHFLDFQ